jgi:hypothetical protein
MSLLVWEAPLSRNIVMGCRRVLAPISDANPLVINGLLFSIISNSDFENLKFAFPITMGMRGSFKALHDIELCGVL